MPSVWLGNTAPIERVLVRDPGGAPRLTPDGREMFTREARPGSSWTRADPDDGLPVGVFLAEIAAFWPYHSDASGPVWVASTDDAWEQAVADHYGIPAVPIPPDAHGGGGGG